MTQVMSLLKDPQVLILMAFFFGGVKMRLPVHHAVLRTVALYALLQYPLVSPGVMSFVRYVEAVDGRRQRCRRRPMTKGQKKNHVNSPK